MYIPHKIKEKIQNLFEINLHLKFQNYNSK